MSDYELDGFDYIRFTGYASMTNPDSPGEDPTVPFGFGSPDRAVAAQEGAGDDEQVFDRDSVRDFPTRPYTVTYEVAV